TPPLSSLHSYPPRRSSDLLNIGAYGAEVVRGALQAVPEAQHEAARALNFSRGHTLFHVILPQAVVEMMPAFGNLAIHNLKDTALASLIAISDLTFQAQRLRNLTLDSVTIYSLTLLGYFAMALLLAAAIRWLERRLRRQTMAGGFAGSTVTPGTPHPHSPSRSPFCQFWRLVLL